MFERLKRLFRATTSQAQRLQPESEVIVRADEEGLSITSPEGEARQILWRDVRRVAIETNDSGPWGADVWWVFEGDDARYAYPQGATGEQQVMDAFKLRLPGFDWEAVIRAQGSTDNARFVCWEKGAKG